MAFFKTNWPCIDVVIEKIYNNILAVSRCLPFSRTILPIKHYIIPQLYVRFICSEVNIILIKSINPAEQEKSSLCSKN